MIWWGLRIINDHDDCNRTNDDDDWWSWSWYFWYFSFIIAQSQCIAMLQTSISWQNELVLPCWLIFFELCHRTGTVHVFFIKNSFFFELCLHGFSNRISCKHRKVLYTSPHPPVIHGQNFPTKLVGKTEFGDINPPPPPPQRKILWFSPLLHPSEMAFFLLGPQSGALSRLAFRGLSIQSQPIPPTYSF